NLARLKINTTLSLTRRRCDAAGRRRFSPSLRTFAEDRFRDTHQASADREQGRCQRKWPDLAQRRLAQSTGFVEMRNGQRLKLTPENHGRRQTPPFPSALLELGNRVVGQRIAETEIADEFPIGGNVERCRDRLGVEDRYPAHANTLRARGEPDRM